jgi:hypothetical protein
MSKHEPTLLELQLIDMLDGFGASQDAEDILRAFGGLGLPRPLCEYMLGKLCVPSVFTLFAIQVEGTDLYLPAVQAARGFSNYDPEPKGGTLGPRLFTTRKRAAAALAAWRIGPWTPVWDSDQDEHGNRFDYKAGGSPTYNPERAKVPLVVVEFALVPKK